MSVEQIEARLNGARARLEAATTAASVARQVSERNTPGAWNRDPGALSGIRRKSNAKKDNARWNAYSREAEAQNRLDKLREDVQRLNHQLTAAIKEQDRERFTAEDLADATHVQDSSGWHKVVKVNPKSVTVETGYSWTDRIPLEKVLHFHAPDSEPINLSNQEGTK